MQYNNFYHYSILFDSIILLSIIMLNAKLNSLSLGSWPSDPIKYKYTQLTPISKKILKQVHLKSKDLLPITFQQFLQDNQYSFIRTERQEQYHLELERRKKKVIILADIRNKYIQGKEYNNKQQKTRSTLKEKMDQKNQKSTKPSQIIYYGQQVNRKIQKLKNKQRNLSKTSSKNMCFKSPIVKRKIKSIQNSQDFLKYNSSHAVTEIKGEEKRADEKRLNKKIIHGVNLVKDHNQYYENLNPNRINRLKSLMKKDNDMLLCKQLIKTIQKWQQLDTYHMRQLSKIKDLSPQQKQRLSKIQFIEKTQLRNKIKRIKSRLNSQGTA